MPGTAVSSAMKSSSETLTSRSMSSRPSEKRPARSRIVDLASRETCISQITRFHRQHVGRRGQVSSEQRPDALHRPPRGSHRELLPGDLKQQGPEQVHWRKFAEPRIGIKVRPPFYKAPYHGIRFSKPFLVG